MQGFGSVSYDVSPFFWDGDGPGIDYRLGPLTWHDGLVLTLVRIEPASGVITFTNDNSTFGSVDVQVQLYDGIDYCDFQTFTFTVYPVTITALPDPIPDLDPMVPSGPEDPVFHQTSEKTFTRFGLSLLYGESQPVDSVVSLTVERALLTDEYLGSMESIVGTPLGRWWTLFSKTLSAYGREDRSQAWEDSFGLLDESKRTEITEELFGLEEFFARLGASQIGDDQGNIRLAFNADDIKLGEWFSSLPASPYEWLNESGGREVLSSDGSPVPWLHGKTLVFNLDDFRLADLFASGSAATLFERLSGSPAMTAERITKVFDLSDISLMDALAS